MDKLLRVAGQNRPSWRRRRRREEDGRGRKREKEERKRKEKKKRRREKRKKDEREEKKFLGFQNSNKYPSRIFEISFRFDEFFLTVILILNEYDTK